MIDCYIGQINMVGFSYPPRDWACCDGQLIPLEENAALYSLIGTTYGGDGRTTFALPDFRGRVPLHRGRGPASLNNYTMGSKNGAEYVALNKSEMPAHTHAVQNQLSSTIPAINSNADSIEPSPNTVLGIGNKPAGMTAEQIKNFSTSAPTTAIAGGEVSGDIVVGNTGANQGHMNLQPFLTVNFVIALQGLFPPRN